MLMDRRLWALFFFVLVVCAVSASAGPVRYYDWASPSPCGNIDPDAPCYASGSDPEIKTCTAKGTILCYSCIWDRYSKRRCGRTTSTGSCKCTDEQMAGEGPGITWCKEVGTCTYTW
jgi:hypothetical protein